MIKHLEKDNFKEEIKTGFVIVDFFAEWCGPCKMITKELESIDESILKVNTDEYPDIAREYGVMSIPTLVFLKDGKEIKRNIGYASASEINEIIKEIK